MRRLWAVAICAAGVMSFAGAAGATTIVYDFSNLVKSGPPVGDPSVGGAHPTLAAPPENAGPITFTFEFGGGVILDSAFIDLNYNELRYRFIQPGQTQVLHDTFSGGIGCTTQNGCLQAIGPGLLIGTVQLPAPFGDPAVGCIVPGDTGDHVCAERFVPTFIGDGLRFQIAGGVPDPNNPDVVGCPDCFARVSVQYGSSVPEPATWALLILGFGFVGGALRQRRTAKSPEGGQQPTSG